MGTAPKKVLQPKKSTTVYGITNSRLEKKVFFGAPGKDGQNADEDAIVRRVLDMVSHMISIPEVPTMEDIVKHLKDNKVLEAKDVQGIPVDANGGFKMQDMRWHGSSGVTASGMSALLIPDSFTATNNQTVFSSSQNVLSTLGVWAGGILQTPTTDYTNTTMILTLAAGVPTNTPVIWLYVKA